MKEKVIQHVCEIQVKSLSGAMGIPINKLFNMQDNELPPEVMDAIQGQMGIVLQQYQAINKNPALIKEAPIQILRMVCIITEMYYTELLMKFGSDFLTAKLSLETLRETRELEIRLLTNIHKYVN